MIMLDMKLLGAITGKVSGLGIITISNINQTKKGSQVLADYQFRVYSKNTTPKQILNGAAHHRETIVTGHAKNTKPVWNLVLKGLTQLGY